MRQLLQNFRHNQSGATSIEYGLIASLIFVALIGGLALLGDSNSGMFARVSKAVVAAIDTVLSGDGEGSEGGEAPAGQDG